MDFNAGLKVIKKMKKSLVCLLIALVCIVGFWQVAFFAQTLKYDILDGYLPGHFFLSECLRNNIFPLWNPYQQLGFPVYADLINTHYIVNQCIARLFPYTNITFHVLFVVYLILAGTGAFQLARKLAVSERMSLLIGIAYPLSGFFTGNAQHMQFIIGAAWLPFALLFFIKLADDGRVKQMLQFVLFTCLLITGGYPPTAILLAYILAVLYVVLIIRFLRERRARHAVVFSMNLLAGVFLIIALCSGLIISLWQSSPFVFRYGQLAYETSVTNPFTPGSLISLISPLTPAVKPDLFNTDLSMNNLYFGTPLLMLFLYGLFHRQNIQGWFLLSTGSLILLISFGDHFFLHKYLYDHLPLFDKFRHPSNLRIFTILAFLLYAGIQVTRYNPVDDGNGSLFRKTYCLFLCIIAAAWVLSAAVILRRAAGPVDFMPTLEALYRDYGIFGPLFFQTSLILILNTVWLYFMVIRRKPALFFPLALAVTTVEMIAFTQLNIRYTVTAEYNPWEIRHFLRDRPRGFPLPDHHLLADNTDQSVSNVPLIHNTNTYAKTVSPDVRYPFTLNGFQMLANDSVLFENSIRNPLLYLADTVIPERNYNKMKVSSGKSSDHRYALVSDSVYDGLPENFCINPPGKGHVICRYFSPVNLRFETQSAYAGLAVLLQNNYPGWKVFIDGKETSHFTVNHTLIGIKLPPGKHEISYRYENRLYSYAAVISSVLFYLLLLLVIVLTMLENRAGSYGFNLSVTAVAALIVLAIFLLRPAVPFEKTRLFNDREICHQIDKTLQEEKSVFLVLNTESKDPFEKAFSHESMAFQRFRLASDGVRLWEMLDTVKADRLLYAWSNVIAIPEIPYLIGLHFPVLSEQTAGERYSLSVYARGGAGGKGPDLACFNDFEHQAGGWTFDRSALDSTVSHSGRYADRLTPDREFGATFYHTVDRENAGETHVFSSFFFLRDGDEPCNLVITLKREGKTLVYKSVDLGSFDSESSGWKRGFALATIPAKIPEKGDEILVYGWNSGKNERLYLDDIKVSITY